ncbi:helix-turn-helix transcriptional regulator [Slackia piriformis]|uniref:helix-turn-helix transcriptional regulator n=1 Tax=Slackia piriformis TaxID=626934 RepID=UPI0029431FEE|nr:helix-turn-helix transcriptional regulator [Slackia piriformis]
MILKDVLSTLRRERGLTQEQLAKRLFITRQAVSRWETGETAPGIDMIKLIARELDVPVTQRSSSRCLIIIAKAAA